jgi:5'-nucleotidase
MKKSRVLLAIVAIFALAIVSCSSSSEGDISLTILQTSDIHDHAGGYGSAASYNPVVTGSDTVLGGYARIASYVKQVRNEKGATRVLLCDSGDFTMGTVYSMTIASAPLSFMFFSMMNYDAVTFGNHETDLGPDALAGFITLAKNNSSVPFTTPIIASNMDANASPAMNALVADGTIAKSTMVVKSGIKIGILGRMGSNAVFDSPNAVPLVFDGGKPDSAAAYAALQSQVNALRAAGAKVVVLLSHEGFTVDPATGYATGNDAELAKNVSGIDVILSGHLHINQTAVRASANSETILVEPGSYGTHVARLDLQIDQRSGKIKSYKSSNVLIDSRIPGDLAMVYVLSGLVNPALDAALAPAFSGLGLAGVDSIMDTVAINDAPITSESITPGFSAGESVLGNLAADAYRNAINGIWAAAYAQYGAEVANAAMTQATGDPNRVQIAFVPGGVIRDPLAVSPLPNISFADLYNVLPLGGDPVDTSAMGYPLLTTYIKGADIYTAVGISLQMGMAIAGGNAQR